MENKLVISVTGASGSIYALQLFNKLMQPNLREQWSKIGVVFSKNALDVWQHELGEFRSTDWEFNFYDRTDYRAPFASGSAKFLITCASSKFTCFSKSMFLIKFSTFG